MANTERKDIPLSRTEITTILCCLGYMRENHIDTDVIELYGHDFTVEDLHNLEEHLNNY